MSGMDQFQDATAVTPDDDTDLSVPAQGLYIGTAGTLRVTTGEGNTVDFGNVTAGTILNLRVTRVHSTGTSASNIVQLQ